MKKINGLIIASALAVVALIGIQINWILTSKKLMEETFNQRVCMALCSTVEDTGGHAVCGPATCSVSPNAPGCAPGATLVGLQKDSTFKDRLEVALAFYQIDVPYEIIVEEQPTFPFANEAGVYTCSEHTSTQVGEQTVTLNFPEKDVHLLSRLGWTLFASMLILILICGLFVAANWQLWRQQQQTQMNIDFFNNMAHEFRTPLTNIRLATNRVLKKQPHLQDNQFLGIIKRENNKLMQQVERVLQMAQVENGDYELQMESIDLKQLIEHVVRDLELQINSKQARIHLDGIHHGQCIQGDPLHLSNVFRNLIDNSLKYSQLKPEITITTEAKGHNILVHYFDNGIGIGKIDQALVFEKFQRVGTGNRHQQKGFGLGLAYVKMIVEKHGGLIKLFSEKQQGLRFELLFPKS